VAIMISNNRNFF